MFGYVRPYKPFMRVCEYDTYKAFYCSLCKDMKNRFGFFPRFTLSYDFAFLAVMDFAVKGKRIKGKACRCIAHPLRKTVCIDKPELCGYSSRCAVILTYHKLKDDLYDKGIKGKILALLALPVFKKPYKSAKAKIPGFAEVCEKSMVLQKKTEKEKKASIDLACEPTAQMMASAFEGISEDAEKKTHLKRFGYFLGRFVYICDALDDLQKDYKEGNFNPLIEQFAIKKGLEKIPADKIKQIHDFTDMTINFTLGALAEEYVCLNLKYYKEITDNVVYLGLKKVYESIKNGTFHKKSNERKEKI